MAGRKRATPKRFPTSRRGSVVRCRRSDTCSSGPTTTARPMAKKPPLPDEQSLMSPVLQVGAGPLTIAFEHRFSFEFTAQGAWDGGVVEISTDDGASWNAVGATPSFYNGQTNGVTSAPIGPNRPAFVNRSTGWPNFTNTSLNLGTDLRESTGAGFVSASARTNQPGTRDGTSTTSRLADLANTPFASLVSADQRLQDETLVVRCAQDEPLPASQAGARSIPDPPGNPTPRPCYFFLSVVDRTVLR